MNKLYYVTYQSFPANTANSLQTITNIKYLVRRNIEIELIFPKREVQSSGDLDNLQKHYDFTEKFKVNALEHNLPFGRIKFLNSVLFHMSHFLWSIKAVSFIEKNCDKSAKFLTRSDWIYYMLAKKGYSVVFECHQISKLRKFVLFLISDIHNAKVVFTSKLLSEEFKINNEKIILENAFDSDFFSKDKVSKEQQDFIFVGNLLRFNKERSIKFLIESFQDERLKEYKLNIIGGPDAYVNKLEIYNHEENISNIKFYGRLSRKETAKKIQTSKVGFLINSSDNVHSTLHTSPLKYFEYLASNLNIVAVDFPSHRTLPVQKNLYYFLENNRDSFVEACLRSIKETNFEVTDIQKYSFETRAEKLSSFIFS